ncbi:MAG: hypothetical protein HYT76_08210 [Deltaproteobacteria bacterium]|nr:hypothetical protein [Deltaproteobacteria bacterium]
MGVRKAGFDIDPRLAAGLGILIALGWSVGYLLHCRSAMNVFQSRSSQWSKKISEAWGNLEKIYGDPGKAHTLLETLRQSRGKSQELYQALDTSLVEIVGGLEKLETQVNGSTLQASQAGIWGRLSRLRKSMRDMETSFSIKREEVDKIRMPGIETREPILAEPSTFLSRLDEKMAQLRVHWKEGSLAADTLRIGNPRQDLPLEQFTELQERIRGLGLSERWLASHPLSSPEAVWGELDNLLYQKDPVSYLNLLHRHKIQAKKAKKIVDELDDAVKKIRASEAEATLTSIDYSLTVVPAADDPRELLRIAMQKKQEFFDFCGSTDDLAAVIKRSDDVTDAFKAAQLKKKDVQDAIDGASATVARVEELFRPTDTAFAEAEATLQHLETTHSKESMVMAWAEVAQARKEIEEARTAVTNIRNLLTQRRHLEANRAIANATRECQEALAEIEDIRKAAGTLEAARTGFQQKFQSLDSLRADIVAKLKHYDGDPELLAMGDRLRERFTPPSAAEDWSSKLTEVEGIIGEWHKGLRKAREAAEKRWKEAYAKVEQIEKEGNRLIHKIDEAVDEIDDAQGMETLDLLTDSKAVSFFSTMSTSEADDAIQTVTHHAERFQARLREYNEFAQDSSLPEVEGVSDCLDLALDLILDGGFDFMSCLNLFSLGEAEDNLDTLRGSVTQILNRVRGRKSHLHSLLTKHV